jgi:hypothetical protein
MTPGSGEQATADGDRIGPPSSLGDLLVASSFAGKSELLHIGKAFLQALFPQSEEPRVGAGLRTP